MSEHKKRQEPEAPVWAVRFLGWFCPASLYEGIRGDLEEQFRHDVMNKGAKRAGILFAWRVFTFLRPGIVLRNKPDVNFMSVTLLRNYFRLSCRQLVKNKTFATVNVLGLAMGMAASLLIYEYVYFEKSYDGFHKNAENIYRVTTAWNQQVSPSDKRATTVPWSGPGVKEAFAEVMAYTRFAPLSTMTGDNTVRYRRRTMDEHDIYLADPGFLEIFSFPLLEGDPASALSAPHSIVLTASMAKKYFGGDSPLGKVLSINTHSNLSGNEYTVTGVIGDPPVNSHMTFDVLVSYSSMWEGLNNGSTYWHWDNTYCYLLLHPEADVPSLEKKISALRVEQFGSEMGVWNDVMDFRLQPLESIHLFSSLKNELSLNGDGRSLYFLVIVGVCILLSAYVNFINLATVKAVERKTEIGVRKIVGSSKGQLVMQLLVESAMINGIALVAAVALARISVPTIEWLFSLRWPAMQTGLPSAGSMLVAAGIVAAGILLSAAYPAFMLASFRPAEALKGGAPSGTGNRWTFRKSLIVLQFIFCMAFITGTVALYRQLQYMKNHDLGMNVDRVVAVQGYGFQPYRVYENFRDRLASSTRISAIGFSSSAPGDEINLLGLVHKVDSAGDLKIISVDEGFFRTLEITFLAGRNFNRSSKADEHSVILNEAAARLLGSDEPEAILHEKIGSLADANADMNMEVIGVIRNYNQLSLKNRYEPIVFVPDWAWDRGWNTRYFFVRLNAGTDPGRQRAAQWQAAIEEMRQAWKEIAPEHPFHYFFLDSYFDQQYKTDTAFTYLFFFFSAFAIFIACLGLFGLVAYIILQRTKEIGIRKVLGASVQNILALLSKDFARLVFIAACVAVPLVWIGLDRWLAQYAFRISLDVALFAVPLVSVFCLALTTVILRSAKVATTNPVESIRHE